MGSGERRSPLAALVLAMVATVVAVQPVFLVGALGADLATDFGFSAAGLGTLIASFRLSAASSARYLGRLTDRLGGVVAMRLGVGVAALTSLAIATMVRDWATLLVAMILAGTGQALTQPAANRMLLSRIPRRRQGIAFGVKQSAPPAASMLAGISVPLIALTVGWRWAFLAVPIGAAFVLVAIGRRRPSAGRGPDRHGAVAEGSPPATLVATLLVAFALANAASSAVPAFFVAAAISGGTEADLAGTMLALGSTFAIAVRVGGGVVADRMRGGHFRLIPALLIAGSTGLFLLGLGGPTAASLGVIVALAGTWGFHGLFWFSLMRAYPGSPGAITGAISPGGLLGGVIGPLGFGVLADAVGYGPAWTTAGVCALLAAVAMALAARRIGTLETWGA